MQQTYDYNIVDDHGNDVDPYASDDIYRENMFNIYALDVHGSYYRVIRNKITGDDASENKNQFVYLAIGEI